MSTSAEVYLWGTPIGTVALADGQRYATFEYARDFLESGVQPSPLAMPLSGQVYTFPALPLQSFYGLPGMLADSLPDKFGNAVIDAWLESQGRPRGSLNAVERLCYMGQRGMGALEFVPATGPEPTPAEQIDVAALARLAESILAKRAGLHLHQDEGAMAQILRVGTSAGGARAKALIAWNEETGEVCSGQINAGEGFGYWLLKFDGVASNADKEQTDVPSYTRIEYAYYLMAKGAGIAMPECRLYEEEGYCHFMSRRFDRSNNGAKIHMQTLGGLAHFDFNAARVHSYEQAAQVMRMLELGQDEVEQLFSRMVFNVMARNQDDHVKNISFLMDRAGKWSLAPAYDVTYAYNPGGAWTGQHQMSINGKCDLLEEADLLASANHMSLKPRQVQQAIDQVRESVCHWRKYAAAAQVPEQQTEAIEKSFCLI